MGSAPAKDGTAVPSHSKEQKLKVTARDDRIPICGWPTDVVYIDHYYCDLEFNDDDRDHREPCHGTTRRQSWENSSAGVDDRTDERRICFKPHTLVIFIPGNPGVVHWYTDSLIEIVQRLGRGFAARGVSYAGHGVGEDVIGTADDHNQNAVASENMKLHGQSYETSAMGGLKGDHVGEEVKLADGQPSMPKDMSIAWTMDGQSELFFMEIMPFTKLTPERNHSLTMFALMQ